MYEEYLPLILQPRVALKNPLGVNIEGKLHRPDLIIPNRHYKLDIRWTAFEPQPGAYVLEPDVADALIKIGANEKMITFHTCPESYRLWPGYQGSPPKPIYYQNMADAIVKAIDLTGAMGVEILKEPNVRKTQISNAVQWHFGAIVNDNESWFTGGQRYGNILREVGWRVLSKRPGVAIYGGALAEDDLVKGANTIETEFLTGAMSVCGGVFPCDALSLHPYINADAFKREAGWETAIKRVLIYAEKLGTLVNRPVLFSETAAIWKDDTLETPALIERQRKYAEKLISDILPSDRVIGATWYNWASQDAWMHCSLVRGKQRGDPDLQPTKAYEEWIK